MFDRKPSTFFVAIFLFCAVTGTQWVLGAQTAPTSNTGQPDYRASIMAAQAYAWAGQPFTGDDAPYAAIRNDVDAEIKRGGDLNAALLRDQKLKNDFPADQQRRFRYAYFLNRLAGLPTGPRFSHLNDLTQVENEFERPPFPATYNYLRLRFLMNARLVPTKYLEPLGERLLQHDPNDFSVVYSLTKIAIEAYAPLPVEKISALIAELKRIDPSDPRTLTLMGEEHMLLWDASHDPAEANEAIAYYQQYLAKAPANYTFRKGAVDVIGAIRKGLAKHY